MAVSFGAPGSVADVEFTAAITDEIVVDPAGRNWHVPTMSQSPGPTLILDPLAAVPEVSETFVRFEGVGNSPTLPAWALSFVDVALIPIELVGLIRPDAATVVNEPALPPPVTAFCAKAVVAIWVVFVPAAAVGAVGVPVRAGDAKGANLFATKAVVASCVVFVPGAAVGAVGVPVNAGDASSA